MFLYGSYIVICVYATIYKNDNSNSNNAYWYSKKYRNFSISEISVFYGPKTQDSRFQGKLFLKILSLGSWDREIQKFQYF